MLSKSEIWKHLTDLVGHLRSQPGENHKARSITTRRRSKEYHICGCHTIMSSVWSCFPPAGSVMTACVMYECRRCLLSGSMESRRFVYETRRCIRLMIYNAWVWVERVCTNHLHCQTYDVRFVGDRSFDNRCVLYVDKLFSQRAKSGLESAVVSLKQLLPPLGCSCQIIGSEIFQ